LIEGKETFYYDESRDKLGELGLTSQMNNALSFWKPSFNMGKEVYDLLEFDEAPVF